MRTRLVRQSLVRRRKLLVLHRIEYQLEAFFVAGLVCVVAHLVCNLPSVGRFDSVQKRRDGCEGAAHGDKGVGYADARFYGNAAFKTLASIMMPCQENAVIGTDENLRGQTPRNRCKTGLCALWRGLRRSVRQIPCPEKRAT